MALLLSQEHRGPTVGGFGSSFRCCIKPQAHFTSGDTNFLLYLVTAPELTRVKKAIPGQRPHGAKHPMAATSTTQRFAIFLLVSYL